MYSFLSGGNASSVDIEDDQQTLNETITTGNKKKTLQKFTETLYIDFKMTFFLLLYCLIIKS